VLDREGGALCMDGVKSVGNRKEKGSMYSAYECTMDQCSGCPGSKRGDENRHVTQKPCVSKQESSDKPD